MSRRTPPECTAAAITKVLTDEGFRISEPTGPGLHDRSRGVFAADLHIYPARVAVYFWPAHAAGQLAAQVATTLDAAGYRTDRVVEHSGEYLVVWTEGHS